LTFPERWVRFSSLLVNQRGGKIVYRLIIAGIGVLAVALLATACGGGGSDEATAQVSKAQFYKQAEAICAKVQKKLQVELAASKNVSKVFSKAAPLLKREAEELEALSGPEAVEEEVKPLIVNVSKASQLVAKEGVAAADAPSIQAYKKEASSLHLSEC
jgi:hypothetical protein